MQRALYSGQRGYSNQRVCSINRNFYLGAQRYAYALWSGDISTGFISMADQREKMLASVNLGQSKWSMDTGGFNGDDPTSENYARWMQFSAFTPIFRVHGTENKQRQPWVFGEKAEEISRKVMEIRYKLIPYIYSYERRAYETGIGLIKPLFYDYPEDTILRDYVDAWMFGDYILVSPVVEKGQTEKEIYLPEGTWIDFFNGKIYSGNQTIIFNVNAETLEDIPLFIKSGGIIPSQEFVNYVGEKPITTLNIDVFPNDIETYFKYYDDDGITYNYEKGEYFIQTMTAKKEDNGALFNISKKEGTYKPELKYYIVKAHGSSSKEVKVNGSCVPKSMDIDSFRCGNVESWINSKDIYGEVTYIKVLAGDEKEIKLLR